MTYSLPVGLTEDRAARSEERHTATTRRIDDHATELAANRAAHGQMRATIEQQGQQLAALGGRR